MTTESPYKVPDGETSQDIDRQITDLESLIKRLQDEIVDMSNEADKPLDEESLREWFTKAHYDLENNDTNQDKKPNINIDSDRRSKNNLYNTDQDRNSKAAPTNSHIFPVIIPNINPLIKDQQYKDISDDFLNNIHTPSISELEDNFAEIRKNFSMLWSDVDDETEEKNEDLVPGASVKYAAIRAQIEGINSKSSGMLLCNSKENLN